MGSTGRLRILFCTNILSEYRILHVKPPALPGFKNVCLCLSMLQSAKLQTLYSQTQSALEESDARVQQLSAELTTAQQEAERLRTEMRSLQVRHSYDSCVNDSYSNDSHSCDSQTWLGCGRDLVH